MDNIDSNYGWTRIERIVFDGKLKIEKRYRFSNAATAAHLFLNRPFSVSQFLRNSPLNIFQSVCQP